MSKVSDGRSVHVGLVGPKPRPRGVGDGQLVNIPVPVVGGKQKRLRKGQPLSGWRLQGVNDPDAEVARP